jgi:hypothetical protein
MKEKRLTDPVTIRINRGTLERLKSFGSYGEIYDTILNKVFDKLKVG